MKPVIFYRRVNDKYEDDKEIREAERFFEVVQQRSEVEPNSLCIGRYSTLPFHKELEVDLAHSQVKMINTSYQHRFIADIKNWAHLIDTFPTWYRAEDVPDKAFPVVIKGSTNSRKDRWDEMMFAKNREDMIQKVILHQQDGFFIGQDIYIRQYMELYQYGEGYWTDRKKTNTGGIPVAHEMRIFVYKGVPFIQGFYWADEKGAIDEHSGGVLDERPPAAWLKAQIDKVMHDADFFVIDVGLLADRRTWKVIELNDGCMSGLSCIEPDDFYEALRDVLKNDGIS